MDTQQPPPFPPDAAAAEPPPSNPPKRTLPWLAVVLTAAADFFIWQGAEGGAPIGCLMLVLAVAFACSKGWPQRRVWIMVGLVALCTVQGFIDFKPSTFLVGSALLMTIIGQVHFPEIRSMLGCGVEVVLAAVFPFPAWRHLRGMRLGGAVEGRTREERREVAWRVLQIVGPALGLGLLFSVCFAIGNPVFSKLASDAFDASFRWLSHLNLSPGRVIFWLAAFTLLLSLVKPLRTGLGDWIAKREIPRWSRRDEQVGRWQSIVVLGLLNGLFFFVNTIDAVYLWGRRSLPEGVGHSAYLHQGVASLVFAVLLSAFVLVLLFQQRLALGDRLLQWLASAWVAQNVVLIAGVFLRLRLYVDEMQLTLLRVGVGLFLLLVIAGFGLLTMYFWQGRSLAWLIRSNVLATFLLFFGVQFVDLGKYIADYNVRRYLHDRGRYPDLEYLGRLGHSAWPALMELHRQTSESTYPVQFLQQAYYHTGGASRATGWRNESLSLAKRRAALREYMELRQLKPQQ
jgi:hypothetical protein